MSMQWDYEDDGMPDSIHDLVVQIVAETFGVDEALVLPDTHLPDLRPIPVIYMDAVEMWLELEDALKLHIPEADVLRWDTVGDILTYLEARLSN